MSEMGYALGIQENDLFHVKLVISKVQGYRIHVMINDVDCGSIFCDEVLNCPGAKNLQLFGSGGRYYGSLRYDTLEEEIIAVPDKRKDSRTSREKEQRTEDTSGIVDSAGAHKVSAAPAV